MKVFILLCFCWMHVASSWQEGANVEPSNEVTLGEPERQFGQEPKLSGKVQTTYSEVKAPANVETSKEVQLGGQSDKCLKKDEVVVIGGRIKEKKVDYTCEKAAGFFRGQCEKELDQWRFDLLNLGVFSFKVGPGIDGHKTIKDLCCALCSSINFPKYDKYGNCFTQKCFRIRDGMNDKEYNGEYHWNGVLGPEGIDEVRTYCHSSKEYIAQWDKGINKWEVIHTTNCAALQKFTNSYDPHAIKINGDKFCPYGLVEDGIAWGLKIEPCLEFGKESSALWKDPPERGMYYGSCNPHGGANAKAGFDKYFPFGLTMGEKAAKTSGGTDISLTIKGVEPLSQCAQAEIPDCYFNIKLISKITFDYEIEGCFDVWAAPLWITRAYYGCDCKDCYACTAAAEIDVLETGNGHHKNLYTNFAGGDIANEHPWFAMDPNDQQTHKGTMTVELDDEGGITIKNSEYPDFVVESVIKLYKGQWAEANGCGDDGPNPRLNEHKEANKCMYKFTSDIYNSKLGQQVSNPKKNNACRVSVKNLKMTPRDGKTWDEIFQGYTPDWKKKKGNVKPNKAPSTCKQLLTTSKLGTESKVAEDEHQEVDNSTSVKVAATVNDIRAQLGDRILAFGGVFVSVAFLFFLRARKQAQEDNAYTALMNATDQEI